MTFFTQQALPLSVQPQSIIGDLNRVPGEETLSFREQESAESSDGSRKRSLDNHEAENGEGDSQKRSQSRPKVLIACHFCRSHKLKCDGNRPHCGNCSRRGHGNCVYASSIRRRGPGRETMKRKAPKQESRKKAPTPPFRLEPTIEKPVATTRKLSMRADFRPSKKPRLLDTCHETAGRRAGDTSDGSSKGSVWKSSPIASHPPPTAAFILAGGRASYGSENGRAYTPASDTSSVDGDDSIWN